MSPKELNTKLLEKFPELNDKFNEQTSWQEGISTGSIVVFEDVFMPFIINAVEKNLTDSIKNIFEFVEELISSNDEYAKNVVEVAIIENIGSYDIKDKIAKFLLPESLKSYQASFSDKH
ncbi:MAG: hypothetical protein MJ213_05495 [Bacilli bacterium]|nr:hypothetical protein [Bacilli bacterium]